MQIKIQCKKAKIYFKYSLLFIFMINQFRYLKIVFATIQNPITSKLDQITI